jgi:uncharacterized protein involved in exopolysaccharide biosynthesis
MPRPRAEALGALLRALTALPEEEGWRLLRSLKTSPGCALLGDLALTGNEVERLAALRAGLAGASFWMQQVAEIPSVPLEEDHGQFI